MFCQKCGTENAQISGVCGSCGNVLNAAGPASRPARRWPVVIFGMVLPWLIVLGVAAYAVVNETVRIPHDRVSPLAYKQMDDSRYLIDMANWWQASPNTRAGAPAVRTVGVELLQQAAATWDRGGDHKQAAKLRQLAADASPAASAAP